MDFLSAVKQAKKFLTGEPQFEGKGKSVSKGVGGLTTIDDLLVTMSARRRLDLFSGVLEPFKENPWVYASITAIAENIANAPRVLSKVNEEEGSDKIRTHELLALLREPNPLMTGAQLMLGTLVFYEGWGEAFWLMERANPGVAPEQIRLAHPSRMRPVYSKGNSQLVGWVYYTGQGRPVPFELWEVLHFKIFNPDDFNRGMPRWVAAKDGIDLDHKTNTFNARFFEENGILSGVLTAKDELDDAQFRRLFQMFNSKEGAGDTPTRVAILDNAEGYEFQPVNPPATDVQFEGIKNLSKQEVFAVYKTNEVVLGQYGNVKSDEGQKDARRAWWQECLIPTINYLEDVINSHFVRFIYPKLRMEWDLAKVAALQEDFGHKLEHAEKLYKLSYPLNAINKRLELGMDDVPWGDVGLIHGRVAPVEGREDIWIIDQSSQNAPPGLSSPADNGRQEEEEGKIIPILPPAPSGAKAISKAKRKGVAKRVLDLQAKFEKQFQKKFERWVMETRVEALRNFDRIMKGYATQGARVKGVEEFILDTTEAEMRYKKIMSPSYFEAVKEGAKTVDLELGIRLTGEFEMTQAIQVATDRFLFARLNVMVPSIVSTVQQNLVRTVREGIVANDGIGELQARIKNAMNTTHKRALVIARTESAGVINGGRYYEMQGKGVHFHEWVDSGDGYVRDSHQLGGEIVKIGERFSNGLRFPGDPSGSAEEVVNCRCVAVAAESLE